MDLKQIQKFKLRNSLKVATQVALIVVFGGALGQQAYAFDYSGFIQSLSGGLSNWTELDARQTELSAQITAATTSGQLTVTDSNELNYELTRVGQVETQMKASGRHLGATDS